MTQKPSCAGRAARQSLETERDAATLCATLAEAEPIPDLQKVYWRLGRRFGPAFALPTIAGMESKIGVDYSKQTGPEAAAAITLGIGRLIVDVG